MSRAVQKPTAKNTRRRLTKGDRSAVSAVAHSGFDLVPRRKPGGKLATMRDYAKVDFKPWKRTPDMHPYALIPSDETLQSCGVHARVAYAVMLRTRDELIEMHGTLDDDLLGTMLDGLAETAEKLKAIVAMLDAATTRVLVSASAHQLAKGRSRPARAFASNKHVSRE